MTPGYARRRDAEQTRRDNDARALGVYVIDCSQMAAYRRGFPDALWARDGRAVMVEHKNGASDQLTEDEADFHAEYPGPIDICRSDGDVLRIAKKWLGVEVG